MILENISSLGLTIGGGFLVGILIGYALKKVVRLVAIVVGLFLTGLAYLQYQQIVTINWDKIPKVSHSLVTTLADTIAKIPGAAVNHPLGLEISSLGIPLTGSISTGFAIGFMKG